MELRAGHSFTRLILRRAFTSGIASHLAKEKRLKRRRRFNFSTEECTGDLAFRWGVLVLSTLSSFLLLSSSRSKSMLSRMHKTAKIIEDPGFLSQCAVLLFNSHRTANVPCKMFGTRTVDGLLCGYAQDQAYYCKPADVQFDVRLVRFSIMEVILNHYAIGKI